MDSVDSIALTMRLRRTVGHRMLHRVLCRWCSTWTTIPPRQVSLCACQVECTPFEDARVSSHHALAHANVEYVQL